MSNAHRSSMRRVASSATLALTTTLAANASLTFNPTPPVLSHAANLVVNGSFENGAPALGNQVLWAQGATGGPSVIPGWSSSGTPSTYATWGSGGVAGQGIRGSAAFPDGQSGVYFGNFVTDVDVTPNFLPDGRVTFATPPTFTPTFGAPCILSQTVNTQLSPAAMYQMTFWVSGEDAASAGTWQKGIMGLRMSNVVGGNPIRYLAIPSGLGGQQSAVYAFDFVPLDPTMPVTIEFINWGHLNAINGVGVPFSSELVLDDVIINAVPAPGGVVAFALGSALTARRRRATA